MNHSFDCIPASLLKVVCHRITPADPSAPVDARADELQSIQRMRQGNFTGRPFMFRLLHLLRCDSGSDGDQSMIRRRSPSLARFDAARH
jgi:hypothetical protein